MHLQTPGYLQINWQFHSFLGVKKSLLQSLFIFLNKARNDSDEKKIKCTIIPPSIVQIGNLIALYDEAAFLQNFLIFVEILMSLRV